MRRGLYAHLDEIQAPKALEDLAAYSMSGKPEFKGVVYRQISDKDARTYTAKGAPVSPGFIQIATSYEIKHTYDQHGSDKTESPRGQVALSISDFSKIPEVTKPEFLVGVKRLPNGQFALQYKKRVNGHVLVVEYMGEKSGKMSFKTMYRRVAERGNPTTPSDPKGSQRTNVQDDRHPTPPKPNTPNDETLFDREDRVSVSSKPRKPDYSGGTDFALAQRYNRAVRDGNPQAADMHKALVARGVSVNPGEYVPENEIKRLLNKKSALPKRSQQRPNEGFHAQAL